MDNNWAHNTNIMVLPFVTDVCSDQRSLHLIPCHTTKLLQLILATRHSQFLQAGMTIRQTMKRSNNFYWLSLPTVHYLTLLKNQFSSRDFQRTSHWVLELSSNLYLLLMILNISWCLFFCNCMHLCWSHHRQRGNYSSTWNFAIFCIVFFWALPWEALLPSWSQ